MTKHTITLNTTCYTIEDGQIVEGRLSDLDHLIETTTRPSGVGPKYYVTTTEVQDDDGETSEVWALATWATWGGPEVIVDTFETEVEASAAAEQTYVHDILNSTEVYVYLDRASAERALADLLAE